MTDLEAAQLRFAKYCKFDPYTGCVIWIGGTTAGRGKTARYGSFWFEGKSWRAHRWAAKYIHCQNIDGRDVDHCCPRIHPRTLCVEHVASMLPSANRDLQWLRIQVGLDEPDWEDYVPDPEDMPWFAEPDWLRALRPRKAEPMEPPF